MWTGWPCATMRSSSTGPVVKAILSWKYFLAFAALVILSFVTMTPLLVILKGKIMLSFRAARQPHRHAATSLQDHRTPGRHPPVRARLVRTPQTADRLPAPTPVVRR